MNPKKEEMNAKAALRRGSTSSGSQIRAERSSALEEEEKCLLYTDYIKPTRPISVNELKELRLNTYRKLRLSSSRVFHTKCNHFYNIKLNSRREEMVKTNESNIDIGNCSVCYKINKIKNKKHRSLAIDMSSNYFEIFEHESKNINHWEYSLEKLFYEWLYQK